MTRGDLEDLAERALGHTPGEAQATAVRERSLLSRFAGSAPTQATGVESVEVTVLCVRDGHTAAATTRRTDEAGLADVARRAAEAAEAMARGGPGSYPGLPEPVAARGHDGFDAATAELDPALAGRGLADAFAAAREAGVEAFGVWTAGAVETAIASSAGLRAFDAVTDAYVKVICRNAAGRSGFAAQTTSSAGALDSRAVAARAASKVSSVEPLTLAPGEYQVVLEPEAVAELLLFLGSTAFNGQAWAEQRSPLSERMGERVVSPAINLSDSPRYAATLPRAFDAEGVPKVPIPLIQDGVAHRVVHDTASAALAGDGGGSTGHALAPGGSPTGPEPTNLVLVGGGCADVAELIAPIERGLYVTRLWYVNVVQPKQTLLTGMTRDGTFLIEDGQIGRPVRDARFTDSVLRILGQTDALSARPELVGFADFYGTRFAYGVVCPGIRARGFRITGSTL